MIVFPQVGNSQKSKSGSVSGSEKPNPFPRLQPKGESAGLFAAFRRDSVKVINSLHQRSPTAIGSESTMK